MDRQQRTWPTLTASRTVSASSPKPRSNRSSVDMSMEYRMEMESHVVRTCSAGRGCWLPRTLGTWRKPGELRVRHGVFSKHFSVLYKKFAKRVDGGLSWGSGGAIRGLASPLRWTSWQDRCSEQIWRETRRPGRRVEQLWIKAWTLAKQLWRLATKPDCLGHGAGGWLD